jgi:hypothetical protein
MWRGVFVTLRFPVASGISENLSPVLEWITAYQFGRPCSLNNAHNCQTHLCQLLNITQLVNINSKIVGTCHIAHLPQNYASATGKLEQLYFDLLKFAKDKRMLITLVLLAFTLTSNITNWPVRWKYQNSWKQSERRLHFKVQWSTLSFLKHP